MILIISVIPITYNFQINVLSAFQCRIVMRYCNIFAKIVAFIAVEKKSSRIWSIICENMQRLKPAKNNTPT